MNFAGDPAPRLYAVPPGQDFARAFARGFRARLTGATPDQAARAEVMVNTRRGARAFEEALIDAAAGSSLLPRIRLLAELGEDPLARPDLPPAIQPLRRQLRLTRLVEAYLNRAEGAPPSAAPQLAESLARLLDELHEEAVAPEALDNLVAGDLPQSAAAHWQNALKFIDILRSAWPAIRDQAEGGALDPKLRQRLVIERLISDWQAAPPAHPVIAAGSTGSVASTAELMATIARLPQGAVVLPGFDRDLPSDIWEKAGPDHPMAPFRRLLDLLAMTPGDVRPWIDAPAATPRLHLLTQALRPAPVADAWQAAAETLAAQADAATDGLTLVEAADPRHEAASIALAIRREIETPGRRIALVTPDAALARRVTAELARFEIIPDDSLGRPLAQTPPAVFLRLLAQTAAMGAEPVRLAGLLQHPLMRPGVPRADHLRMARRYEIAVLRARPQPGLAPGALPSWDDAGAGVESGEAAWLSGIERPVATLARALTDAPLAGIIAAHIDAAEALTRPEAGAEAEIWQAEAGTRLLAAIQRLAQAADAHGPDPVSGYLALLDAALAGETLPPEAERPHPRVMIWGTQEARVQGADLVILGGLNEGTWPQSVGPDPWLSRPMRDDLGLPSPDRVIGLSAHDFLQGAARPRAILTRSRKVDGTPTVASRWLIRLENLLSGLAEGAALKTMRARGAGLLALVDLIHQPATQVERAPRPKPCPPVAARPRRLSVTRIEILIRDAYAVYAEKILRLSPLNPLGRPADFRERGMIMHEIMERFTYATLVALPQPAEARAILLEVAEDVLADLVPWPDLRRIWRARIARFADWFIEAENLRRATGKPAGIEVKGELVLPAPAGPFTLSARADRIDLLTSGEASIYDYKAGAPPSMKQIDRGFSHQLHLQAAILAAGGFHELPALTARSGAYLGLTGSRQGGVERSVEDLAGQVDQHLERLHELLAAYDRPETSYRSRGMPLRAADEGDYDHLARRAEWDGADGDD